MNYKLNAYYTVKESLNKKNKRILNISYLELIFFLAIVIYLVFTGVAAEISLPIITSSLLIIGKTQRILRKNKKNLSKIEKMIAKEEQKTSIRQSFKKLETEQKEQIKEILNSPEQLDLANQIVKYDLQDTLESEEIYCDPEDLRDIKNSTISVKKRKRIPKH